jgi:hypothetical protein
MNNIKFTNDSPQISPVDPFKYRSFSFKAHWEANSSKVTHSLKCELHRKIIDHIDLTDSNAEQKSLLMKIIGTILNPSHLPIVDIEISGNIISALIDTGADISLIHNEYATRFGLKNIGPGTFTTQGITTNTEKYNVDITFLLQPHQAEIRPIRGIGRLNTEMHSGDMSLTPYKAVIGCNVLSKCKLVYDGKNNSIILEWNP